MIDRAEFEISEECDMSALNEIAMSATAVNIHATANAKTRPMKPDRRAMLARYAATMKSLIAGSPLPDDACRQAVENFFWETGWHR